MNKRRRYLAKRRRAAKHIRPLSVAANIARMAMALRSRHRYGGVSVTAGERLPLGLALLASAAPVITGEFTVTTTFSYGEA
jgi:hypothetical protein